MSHSYTMCLIHFVFSTKQRQKLVTDEIRPRLWPYMGGIAREHNINPIAFGGTDDHVHLLLGLPSTLSIAKAIQLVKGGSSKWVHDTFQNASRFAWQEGYGVFSIGASGIDETTLYIQNQEEHHRTRTFKDEFIAFLKKHNIDYDPRYIFG